MLITAYVYVLYNATNLANNITNSVSLERDKNSCYNIEYISNATGLGKQFAWILCSVIVFAGIFLIGALYAFGYIDGMKGTGKNSENNSRPSVCIHCLAFCKNLSGKKSPNCLNILRLMPEHNIYDVSTAI